MSAAREAIYLPVLFLTVVLLGGVHLSQPVAVTPPTLFSLVLAMLLVAALVRSGALAPQRLVRTSRSALANLNGVIVLLTLFAGSAQAFTLATPRAGLPLVLFNTLLLILLVNTMVAAPDRRRLLRSLLVVFGSAFVLKFVVLAALSEPSDGRLSRVLQLLFEGITLGTLSQEVLHPAAGYLAFATLVLYLGGLAALPWRAAGAQHNGLTFQNETGPFPPEMTAGSRRPPAIPAKRNGV
jgi:hypothetical protein